MTEEFEPDDRRTAASPWPILVALGIVLSELGVFFGVRPVSVGGLLLLVGAVAASLRDSGHVARPERAIAVQGAALVGVGLALVAVDLPGSTVRGKSIAVAGAIGLLGAPLWAWADART